MDGEYVYPPVSSNMAGKSPKMEGSWLGKSPVQYMIHSSASHVVFFENMWHNFLNVVEHIADTRATVHHDIVARMHPYPCTTLPPDILTYQCQSYLPSTLHVEYQQNALRLSHFATI